MATINRFKTSDIKISTDSSGMMTATHKYQGTLDDGTYWGSRAECRKQAVKTLMEIKEQGDEPQAAAFDLSEWKFSPKW